MQLDLFHRYLFNGVIDGFYFNAEKKRRKIEMTVNVRTIEKALRLEKKIEMTINLRKKMKRFILFVIVSVP